MQYYSENQDDNMSGVLDIIKTPFEWAKNLLGYSAAQVNAVVQILTGALEEFRISNSYNDSLVESISARVKNASKEMQDAFEENHRLNSSYRDLFDKFVPVINRLRAILRFLPGGDGNMGAFPVVAAGAVTSTVLLAIVVAVGGASWWWMSLQKDKEASRQLTAKLSAMSEGLNIQAVQSPEYQNWIKYAFWGGMIYMGVTYGVPLVQDFISGDSSSDLQDAGAGIEYSEN